MTARTITAMFENRAEAERAVEALVRETGLARTAVRLDTSTGTAAPQGEKGFLASLRELFVPDADSQVYAEGLRRGNAVISALVEEAQVDRAMDVLEQNGAIDLDEREAQWRSSGWTGGTATAGTGAVVGAVSEGSHTGMAARPATGTSVTPLLGEEVIPIVEERLRVGKREVDRGRVRIRSYVVETPVQEQVTLREEHVDVQRRVVDRPVTEADRLFQDRTIEATEFSEEAVVDKDARVTEEIVVSKGAEERVTTVHAKVRRTEVEVDDQRTASPAAKTDTAPKATPPQPAPKMRDRT